MISPRAWLVCLVAAMPLITLAEVPKAVLVTGSSSGIGHRITERLAADGYFVYAGARKEEDLKALGLMKNVQAIRLDVTKPADIAAAVETVTKAGRGLYGLVNNAGVVTVSDVLTTKPEEFDVVMAVNVAGPWYMTRAFAPLIISAKGRITNIGSLNGIISGEKVSAYAMSKHAMEAFTDSLAVEMAPFGVGVSIVDPGSYNSNIVRNEVRRTGETGLDGDRSSLKDPEEVAIAVEQALFDPKPKLRYMVVPNREQAEATIRAAIQRLVQLNEGQLYTYKRDALVKMLDEALAPARPGTAR